MAFQNQVDSQNIGYVIPAPTIAHFLADVKPDDARQTNGFPSLGIYWQALENPQLREFLGMGTRSGVMLRGVMPTSPAAALLRRGDILLELDGHAIANDGSFGISDQERLSFAHLVHLKFSQQAVHAVVLRDGAELASARVGPHAPKQPLRPSLHRSREERRGDSAGPRAPHGPAPQQPDTSTGAYWYLYK